MKILMGEFPYDKGEVLLRSAPVGIASPAAALNLGIAMIYQELSPVPDMNIAENIFLGREPNRFGILNTRRQENRPPSFCPLSALVSIQDLKMRALSVAATQLVETAKAISYNSRILIMDEPTSAINEAEVRKLFDMIRLLRSRGVAIIYISHKIDELFEIADRATILVTDIASPGRR